MNLFRPVLILLVALSSPFFLGAQNGPPSEEVITKMKTALAPLFQENQDYVFSDLKSEAKGNGFRISGNATFFQMNSVTLVATFASADVMARFELQFPAGSKLPNDAQQKLAKQNIVNWMPQEIQKVVSLQSLYVELAQNTISTVGIHFAAQQDWNPVAGIAAKNIAVDFNLNNPLGTVSISSTLKSDFKIGDASIKVGATLSSNPNDCVLSGDISNLSLGNVLSSIGMNKAPEWPDALLESLDVEGHHLHGTIRQNIVPQHHDRFRSGRIFYQCFQNACRVYGRCFTTFRFFVQTHRSQSRCPR